VSLAADDPLDRHVRQLSSDGDLAKRGSTVGGRADGVVPTRLGEIGSVSRSGGQPQGATLISF
jgi:hypothetical protein